MAPTLRMRAEQYDALIAEIATRQPSMNLVANNTRAGRIETPMTLEQRFLWTFDQLVDHYKQSIIAERERAERLYADRTAYGELKQKRRWRWRTTTS